MTPPGTIARSDLSQLWFTIVSLLTVGCAFGLSWAGFTFAALIVCLTGIGSLAWFCYARCALDRDGDSLHEYAERLYLLGYLLTISAIAGVVLQTGGGDTASLLRTGGVKLVTTIAGLLVMFWFKERAQTWEREAKRSTEEDDKVLNSQLRTAIRSLNEQADDLQKKFGGVVAAFTPATLETMAAASSEMARLVRETAGSFPGLKAATEQLASNLGEIGAGSKHLENSISSLSESFSELQRKDLRPAGEAFAVLAAGAGRFAQIAQQFDPLALTKLQDAMTHLSHVFVALESQIAQLLSSSQPNAQAPVHQLAKSLELSSKRIEEQGERFVELGASLALLNASLQRIAGQSESSDRPRSPWINRLFSRKSR